MIKDLFVIFSFRRMKKPLVAFVLSLVAMSLFLVNACWKWSLGLESSLLGKYEMARRALSSSDDSLPQEVFLVNVAYDRQLADISDEWGLPVGNTDITDRSKLYHLLSQLHQLGDYRYIVLDIDLNANSCQTNIDDSLYQLIGRMSRIVVPDGGFESMMSPQIETKSASSVYVTNILNDKCSKYPLVSNSRPSVALKMYEELSGVSLSPSLFMYSDGNGCLPKTLPLSISYYIDGAYSEEGEKIYYNMGTDLLDDSSDCPAIELARDKVVLIGDYVERDMHPTYLKDMPGTLIHYNAYRSLVEQRAYIDGWLLLLLWLVCMYITLTQLYDISLNDMLAQHMHIRNGVWQFVLTWLDYTLLLEAIMITYYIYKTQVYEILLLAIYLTIQKNVICWTKRK